MACNRAKKSRTAAEEDVDQFEYDDMLLAMEKLQDELNEINDEYDEKILEINQKYNEVREPVYVRRNEIINSIPDFWLTAILNHCTLGKLVTEEDQKIFKYVDSLHVENFKEGYRITFNFKANPYFENAKLTKTLKYIEEGFVRSTGTTIKWKEGKAPADGSDEKKGNRGPLDLKSFFSWFGYPPEDKLELEMMGVGYLIMKELWPNPIEHHNNEDDKDDFEKDKDDDGLSMVSNRTKRSRTAAAGDVDQFEYDDMLLAMEKIQEVQNELEKINYEADEKILEVEQKYNEMRKPVYVRRNEIISSIPDFWLTAFLNHHTLGYWLKEEDQKIFKYVDSLHVENFIDPREGYCITFKLKANPYFENTKLTKAVTFFVDGTLKSTGTTIKWKEGKAPADGSDDEKKGDKRSLRLNSFFSWFSFPPEDKFEVERYGIAELIEEELWANPIKYFNNEDYEDDSEEFEDDDKSRTAVTEDDDQFEYGDMPLAMEKLQEVQDELEKINEDLDEKILAIERKYVVREHFYARRNKIINSIPDFWVTALLNHPTLGRWVTEEDQKIFKYLDSLHVENLKDFRKGYCIIFNFKANPYFENTKLTKTIKYFDDRPLLSSCTKIKWKEGKTPAAYDSDYGKEGSLRPLPLESSFFCWFTYPPEETLAVEYDPIAELIKREIWPNPMEYFNNEYDDEDDYEEGEDDNDEDELEEDEIDQQDGSGKKDDE